MVAVNRLVGLCHKVANPIRNVKIGRKIIVEVLFSSVVHHWVNVELVSQVAEALRCYGGWLTLSWESILLRKYLNLFLFEI